MRCTLCFFQGGTVCTDVPVELLLFVTFDTLTNDEEREGVLIDVHVAFAARRNCLLS